MKTKRTILAGVLALLVGATLLAQQPSEMDQRHRELMPLHAKLIEKQKAQDAEIDKLLSEMNSATGEKRVDAIIAVLNKLVEQRKAMSAEMAAHLDR